MNNQELLKKAESYKNGDMSAFDEIFSKFEGLIYTYSARLGGEDAFQELSLFLIELLYKIRLSQFSNDGELIRYIAVCLRNEYIRLSKERSKLLREQNPFIEIPHTSFDPIEKEILRQGVASLTEKQQKTVIYKYIYCYSDAEIAKYLNITRQAVNRIKTRALENLKLYLEEEKDNGN